MAETKIEWTATYNLRMTTKGETMTNEQHEAVTVEAMHAGTLPSWLTPAAATPSPAVTEVTRLKAVVAALVDEHNAANARAEEAEAISYDIAAKSALDAQNWREELTAMRQRLDAAEAKLAAARADLDMVVGYLDAVMNGLSVKELAQLADVAAEVRQRWGLEA